MQELIYREMKKITGFPNADGSYSPMFSSIGLNITPNKNGVSNLYLAYNGSSRSIFNGLIGLPFPLNTTLSSVYKLVFGFNKGILAFWKNDGFIFECEGLRELPLLASVSSATADLWIDEDASDSEYLILHGYSVNNSPFDPDAVVPFIFGIRAIEGTLETHGGFRALPANGKIILAFDFEALKATTKYVKNMLACAPQNAEDASRLCRRWVRNNSRAFEFEAGNETQAKNIACALKGMLFNFTKAQGRFNPSSVPFPSRGTAAFTSVWDLFLGNPGYSLLGTNLSKEFIKNIARTSRSDGKIYPLICSTYERTDYRFYPLLGRMILNEIEFDYSFVWDVIEALEENNKWWLTARISDCGLVFEEIDKRPVITIAVNAFLFDQLKATAELSARLGLDEKTEKWSRYAESFEQNIIENFYDAENNTFSTVFFNRGKSTRIDAEKPDDFSSLIPLWAGVGIGEENTVKLIENSVIPHEAKTPEQVVIKLDILKKYGFNEEYEKTKEKFLASFSRPADFNNSVRCAVYLKLVTENISQE